MDRDRKSESNSETREARLLALAQCVSEGGPVDWEHLAQVDMDDEEGGIVHALRIVDEIARVHKSSLGAGTLLDEARAATHPGRWRHLAIIEPIGQGTFGNVYRAREDGLDREVALKLITLRSGAPSVGASAMFTSEVLTSEVLKEARLLARVRHPNVVTVYGAESAEGRVGLWMELIKGRTLEDLLAAHGAFSAKEAAAIGTDLCHALAAVHGAGLLHRDVKCRNVMREEGGRIVLMDFGAGTDESAERRPAHEDVAGTPMYLAPELFAGGRPSIASDIYSLGVLVYHLVSNAYPVQGRTKDEIRDAHVRSDRLRLRDCRPDLPDAFVRVVERALSADPKQRYETAGGFADALSASSGVSIPRGASENDADRGQRAMRVSRASERYLLVAAALALLASVGGGVWWAASGSRGTNEQAAEFVPATRPGRPDVVPAAATDSYEISARFHVARDTGETPLRTGERLALGDKLFLTVHTSTPAYLYVVNRDEKGESYLNFPLPGQSVKNPLPAGAEHRIPGSRDGEDLYWQVTSLGGREHFFVFASPNRLEEFERLVSVLPQPVLDKPLDSVPLSNVDIEALRGVGGLAKSARPTGAFVGFPAAKPLLDLPETTRGFWAREAVFENPAK
jgi:serine/threonine protein kinase